MSDAVNPVASWGSLLCSRAARLGLAGTLLIVTLAALGPLMAPHSAYEVIGIPFTAASANAPLGTDYLGRDTLSRVLWGGWSVLWMSVAASLLAALAGTFVGILVAWMGGVANRLVDWINDVLLAFPMIVLAALLVAMVGRSPQLIVGIVALGWMPTVIRLSRSIALATIRQEFVAVAELLGTPRLRILLHEVLPNIVTPLIVQAGALLTWSVSVIAGLNFLGFGIEPPTADWGLMVNENRGGLLIAPWATVAPVILIGLFALATNVLADAVNDEIGRKKGEGR